MALNGLLLRLIISKIIRLNNCSYNNMTAAQFSLETNTFIEIAEPIFISHYKNENGNSPTLYELKQFLVSHTSEKLISILQSSDSSIFNSMPTIDLLSLVNIYVRKLRVW